MSTIITKKFQSLPETFLSRGFNGSPIKEMVFSLFGINTLCELY